MSWQHTSGSHQRFTFELPKDDFDSIRSPFGKKLPDLFRNDYHMWLIENPDGRRKFVYAITGSYGNVRYVESIPSNRTFVRISEDGFFMDQFGKIQRLEHPSNDEKVSSRDETRASE